MHANKRKCVLYSIPRLQMTDCNVWTLQLLDIVMNTRSNTTDVLQHFCVAAVRTVIILTRSSGDADKPATTRLEVSQGHQT